MVEERPDSRSWLIIMHILQINSVCGIGSTGRIASDLHAMLLAQGHKSHVAYGRDSARSCNQAIKISSAADNYVHVLMTRLFDAHGFASSQATKSFIKELRELRPDVIHLHNLHGYYLHIGLLFDYLRQSAVPVVWTFHDCWPFTGHCAHFDFVGCQRWKTGCFSCPLKTEYPKSVLFDRSKKNYQNKKNLFTGLSKLTVVTPSRWLKDLVKQSFLQDYPVELISNGIDLKLFTPVDSRFKERYNLKNHFLILGVANIWGERKGFDFFLKLAEQLNSDEKIVLLGLTRRQIRYLPRGILGIERTNSVAELVEIYSAANVFVNPTLEDNFPTTNLEAMACGTPVITFASGGSPECVDEKTGIVVPRGDLQGLVRAVAAVKQAGKAHYSENCRKRAERFYNKDERFAEYISLYEKVLSLGNG